MQSELSTFFRIFHTETRFTVFYIFHNLQKGFLQNLIAAPRPAQLLDLRAWSLRKLPLMRASKCSCSGAKTSYCIWTLTTKVLKRMKFVFDQKAVILLHHRPAVFCKLALRWGRSLSLEPFVGKQPVHAATWCYSQSFGLNGNVLGSRGIASVHNFRIAD